MIQCPTCKGLRCNHPERAKAIHAWARDITARAFRLVNPYCYAQELARRGLLDQTAADAQDWRGPIARAVTIEDLAAAGVTAQDVLDAIWTMTGSRGQAIPATISGTEWVSYLAARPGFNFVADGFRAAGR